VSEVGILIHFKDISTTHHCSRFLYSCVKFYDKYKFNYLILTDIKMNEIKRREWLLLDNFMYRKIRVHNSGNVVWQCSIKVVRSL